MTVLTAREKLIKEIDLSLGGGGMVDIELEPGHFNLAIDRAFERYRQRSSNASEESFIFLDVQPDRSIYQMPDEVQDVRAIYRRSMGGTGGTGTSLDPFSAGVVNSLYLLQGQGVMGGGSTGAGSLATYDFAAQYQSLAGRMFGRDVMYTWDTGTKRLTLQRKFTAIEQIAVHAYVERPEFVILKDNYAKPWIRAYAIALCKIMLGEARSKYGTMAGPQGGITLNGEAMKNEGTAEIISLDLELKVFIDSQSGMPFIIG